MLLKLAGIGASKEGSPSFLWFMFHDNLLRQVIVSGRSQSQPCDKVAGYAWWLWTDRVMGECIIHLRNFVQVVEMSGWVAYFWLSPLTWSRCEAKRTKNLYNFLPKLASEIKGRWQSTKMSKSLLTISHWIFFDSLALQFICVSSMSNPRKQVASICRSSSVVLQVISKHCEPTFHL